MLQWYLNASLFCGHIRISSLSYALRKRTVDPQLQLGLQVFSVFRTIQIDLLAINSTASQKKQNLR